MADAGEASSKQLKASKKRRREKEYVVEKVVRMFREVGLQDLPALVYQLLLLSTKVSLYSGFSGMKLLNRN